MSEKIFENSTIKRMQEMAGVNEAADPNNPAPSPQPTPPLVQNMMTLRINN
jgi:hypothetical protein